MAKFLRLHPVDNVATALTDVPAGSSVELEGACGVVTKEDILFEHKVALCDIPEGADVIKYGVSIGVAYRPIRVGEHVHLHNLRSRMTEEVQA